MKNIIFYLIIALAIFTTNCEKLPIVGEAYKLQPGARDYDILTDTLNTIIISGHILNATSNDVFILLYQKPVDRICECTQNCLYDKYPNANDLPTYKMCKEAFEKSTLRQYWIVDKSEESIFDRKTKTRSNVYGPYSKEEYLKKRVEIGVPYELRLVVEGE